MTWIIFSNVVDRLSTRYATFEYFFKELLRFPVSVPLYLYRLAAVEVFIFLLSALRFQLPFFRFGSAKVEIFFLSASFFLKILFFVLLALLLIFNPFQPCAFWLVFPLFGVAKVRFFFHFCKKFFNFFLAPSLPSFQYLRLPCAASFLLSRFVLGLQR